MKEKRRQVRREAKEFLIACDSQTGAVIGQVADMTEQGIMLLSEKPRQPHTIEKCIITLPERTDGKDYISFEMECMWCVLDKESGMYQMGYEFRRMTPVNIAVIQGLLKTWPISNSKVVQA